MHLLDLKKQFESNFAAYPPSLSAAQAWEVYRDLLFEGPDGEWGEEVSFNAGVATCTQAGKTAVDLTRYQIYLGRLIDVRDKGAWRTLEINFYFRFGMTPSLELLLAERDEIIVEDAWGAAAGAEAVREKRAEFIRRVEEQANLLTEIWELKPDLTDLQIQLW